MRVIDEWIDEETGPASLQEDDAGCLWTVADNLDGEYETAALLQRRIAVLAREKEGKVLVRMEVASSAAQALLERGDRLTLDQVLVNREALEMSLCYTEMEAALPQDGEPSGILRHHPTGTRLCRWIGPDCDLCKYEAKVLEGGALEVVEPHSGTCPLAERTP